MNTLQYSLHKAVGDVVPVPNATSPEYALKIVGMWDGSVFQGVLVVSEANFNRMFPGTGRLQLFPGRDADG